MFDRYLLARIIHMYIYVICIYIYTYTYIQMYTYIHMYTSGLVPISQADLVKKVVNKLVLSTEASCIQSSLAPRRQYNPKERYAFNTYPGSSFWETHISIHLHGYVGTPVVEHSCIHVSIHIYICIYIYADRKGERVSLSLSIYIHICMSAYARACIRIYMYIYIHVYICRDMYSCVPIQGSAALSH